MFENTKETIDVLQGTYKKFKSFYYYDKTMLHIKQKIIEFESTKEIEKEFKNLAEKIVSKDEVFFDTLINEISYVVLPKSFETNVKNGIVSGNVDKNKKIKKINFAIDMPMELYLIDFLWTLLISKISKDKELISDCSYAARMKKGIVKEGESLVKSIDFLSNRCYEPYFTCYTLWRNNALNKAKKVCKENDVIMLSLDMKSFYYSVDFDFNELEDILDDPRWIEFAFLTDIIKKIYTKYTLCISELKKGVTREKSKNIFPIGLISPFILRDIVMKKIDDAICEILEPHYYGRYVDDMLLVVNGDEQEQRDIICLLEKLFVNTNILKRQEGEEEYSFVLKESLKVQFDKVNCFFFGKEENNVLLDVYLSKIKKNSSEANLLPDMDLLKKSFIDEAYAINVQSSANKIRNIRFMESNNYNATLFINGLKQLLLNTSFEVKSIEPYLSDILNFYEGSQAIEFFSTWKSIFELFVLCRDTKRINQFYSDVRKLIMQIEFTSLDAAEIYEEKRNKVLSCLKETLVNKLDVSISMALALDYRNDNDERSHVDMAKKTRLANMMNHNMVSMPLLNYTYNEHVIERPLINFDYNDLLSDVYERNNRLRLSKRMLKWSPRFVHLHELYLSYFYFNIGVCETFIHEKHDLLFKLYLKINRLSPKISRPIDSKYLGRIEQIPVCTKILSVTDSDVDSGRYIGVVNVKIDEKEELMNLQQPSRGFTLNKKRKLYKLLNEAREEKVKYLVFPEYYMPSVWLLDICRYARNARISIITGLQYIKCNRQAFNVICNLQSACSVNKYKNIIPLFREKNYYPPAERIDVAQNGYFVRDPKAAIYTVISDGKVSYSTILCYEFTDIASRCVLKGKTDFIFVPQLNRDTNYFSSIVEATARDLHTIIVQANTSKYGDSRITGPFKTDFKDVMKIKGGKNEVLMVGDVNWKELQEFRRSYYQKLYDGEHMCLNCNISNKDCGNCGKNFLKDKSHIKGLPPKWI